MRRFRLGPICVLLAAALATPVDADIKAVEDEFEKAIRKVAPATVVCLAKPSDPKMVLQLTPASGVIVSRKGLVLSDGDVGAYVIRRDKKPAQIVVDQIEVRVPNLKGKGFQTFTGKVIARSRDYDTSLIQIEDAPSRGFDYVRFGNSDDLRVGSFSLVMGNAFGMAEEAPPTLTAGVISSVVPAKKQTEGKYEQLYTSAAVNPGVRGGPLVDIEGRLVGTISNAVLPTENGGNQPYQFLGRAMPVERLKAFYAGVPEAEKLFAASTASPRSRKSAILETVFHQTAQRAYPGTVSLEIHRKEKFVMAVPSPRGLTQVLRYTGPVSGVLVSQDGLIVTSLYNLANVTGLVQPPQLKKGQPTPPALKLSTGLNAIEKITAFMPDGRAVEARYLARHDGLGIALLQAQLDEKSAAGGAESAPTRQYAYSILEPVSNDYYRPGKMVLALGNPFGKNRLPDPLLAVGILSKQHAETETKPWAGQWQTDASGTDATCGGAAVSLSGKLIGMMNIWFPPQHGRNSGIAFIVPWTQIEPVLEDMKAGRTFGKPRVGIEWDPQKALRIRAVAEGGPAATAGIKGGDVLIKIGDVELGGPQHLAPELRGKWSGDKIVLTVIRDGEELRFEVTLGEWP